MNLAHCFIIANVAVILTVYGSMGLMASSDYILNQPFWEFVVVYVAVWIAVFVTCVVYAVKSWDKERP